MRQDLTDITVVTDRSGSMSTCKQEAENGLNHFIEEQKKQPGSALFSLVQFDTEYEFLYRGVPIESVARYRLIPRGMTALLDAVGRAVNETGARLREMAEADRPGLVIFVIVTDGQENSSHEFTKAQIKEMIEHQQKDYAWQFTFLGANQDAFAEAHSMGIQGASVQFMNATAQAAYTGASANVSRMRGMSSVGAEVKNFYTQEEQDKMSGNKTTS